jgi:GNAT superfamily N-acetyltransferase
MSTQDLKPAIPEAPTTATPTTTTTPAPRPNPPASVPARTSHSLDPNLSPRTQSEQKMVAMAERALQSAGSTPDARSAANTALMRFFTASMDKTYSSWRLPVAERVLASPHADNDCRVAANALVAKGLFRLARGIKRGLSDAHEVAHKAEAVRDSSRSDGVARRAANEALERVFDWVCTGEVLQHAWSTEYAERSRDSPNTNDECRLVANALLTKILKDSTFS